jgi:hypothetical protein
MCQFACGLDGEICIGEVWHLDMLREKFESIHYPQTVGYGGINSIIPVIVTVKSDAPDVHSVWRPGAAILGLDICHCPGFQWRQRCAIEIGRTGVLQQRQKYSYVMSSASSW